MGICKVGLQESFTSTVFHSLKEITDRHEFVFAAHREIQAGHKEKFLDCEGDQTLEQAF